MGFKYERTNPGFLEKIVYLVNFTKQSFLNFELPFLKKKKNPEISG
jgi:hypothetical protein